MLSENCILSSDSFPVIVCGGRDYCDKKKVFSFLDSLLVEIPNLIIVAGGARGADTFAASWALANSVPLYVQKADWDTHGKAAGPIRNDLMLAQYKPKLVIAFPGGTGTAHMVRRAREENVEVRIIT